MWKLIETFYKIEINLGSNVDLKNMESSQNNLRQVKGVYVSTLMYGLNVETELLKDYNRFTLYEVDKKFEFGDNLAPAW